MALAYICMKQDSTFVNTTLKKRLLFISGGLRLVSSGTREARKATEN